MGTNEGSSVHYVTTLKRGKGFVTLEYVPKYIKFDKGRIG